MANQIFRQAALDRMASPDRLDQPVKLVRNQHWWLLACFTIVMVFALIWSLLVSLPIKVKGKGILINRAGLSEITIAYDGRIAELLVKPGDTVVAGAVVARMTVAVKQQDIALAKSALQASKTLSVQNEAAFIDRQARHDKVDRQRLASNQTRSRDLRKQLVTRQTLADNITSLVEKGAVTPLELVSLVGVIDSIQENIRQLEQDRLEIEVAAAQRLDTRAQEHLLEQQEISKYRLELQRLEIKTLNAVAITAFQAGRIAEIKVNPGDVLQAGQAIATLNPNPDENRLQAMLYVPPAAGKRVVAGMQVEIIPSTSEVEIYGHILATVEKVALLPASSAGMRRSLQNDRLVDELAAAGAPIEVRVTLLPADNGSGFTWSSSSGPANRLTAGTLLEGRIIVERRAIIDVILPGLRNKVSYRINQ